MTDTEQDGATTTREKVVPPEGANGAEEAIAVEPDGSREAIAQAVGGAGTKRSKPERVGHPSIMDIKVELRFVLGHARVDVGELMELDENQVIAMDRGDDDLVDLVVNGSCIAQGELVENEAAADGATGKGLGVRVTRICSPASNGRT